MASANKPEGAEEARGAIPGQNFTTTCIKDPGAKLEVMLAAQPGTDPPDTNDQKAQRDCRVSTQQPKPSLRTTSRLVCKCKASSGGP